MSANALSAQGVTIARGSDNSPYTYSLIKDVTSIGGPSGSAMVIDASDLDSSSREKKMGLTDEGQITLELHYLPDDTQHEGLRTDRANRTLRKFRITFTDTSPKTTYTFSAYVTGFNVNAAVDQLVTVSVTLEISGVITKA